MSQTAKEVSFQASYSMLKTYLTTQ